LRLGLRGAEFYPQTTRVEAAPGIGGLESDSMVQNLPQHAIKAYEVRKGGQPVELTTKEFALLRLFINRRNEVLRRDVILDEVWGDYSDVFHRTVDTHIVHLRQKLEDDATNPKVIVNIRAVGYKFVPDPA